MDMYKYTNVLASHVTFDSSLCVLLHSSSVEQKSKRVKSSVVFIFFVSFHIDIKTGCNTMPFLNVDSARLLFIPSMRSIPFNSVQFRSIRSGWVESSRLVKLALNRPMTSSMYNSDWIRYSSRLYASGFRCVQSALSGRHTSAVRMLLAANSAMLQCCR